MPQQQKQSVKNQTKRKELAVGRHDLMPLVQVSMLHCSHSARSGGVR
jgi:hypothetical protein